MSSSCPNCGYCKECGRAAPVPSFPTQRPSPFVWPTVWYCWRCGRNHGMYEICMGTPTWTSGQFTFTDSQSTSLEIKP